MSYKDAFSANNTDLQAILDKINALPDAASGASVDTCTIVLKHDDTYTSKNAYWYACTRYEDGAFISDYAIMTIEPAVFPITLENVVCGSALFVRFATDAAGVSLDVSSTNGSTHEISSAFLQAAITVTSTPGVTDTITIVPEVD